MFSEKDLKKKAVFFGFEDTLVSGKIDSAVDMEAVVEILSNLQSIEKAIPSFHMVLISGLSQEFAEKRIAESGIGKFFLQENIFYVTLESVEDKEEVDRSLYLKKISENPEYKDEFLKQIIIEKYAEKNNLSKEEMVFIGHDVWFDGFYTMKFSKIDFALLRKAYSFMGKPFDVQIKGLIYIDRNWNDVKELILGKKPVLDLAALEKFAEDKIREQLLGGTALGGLSKIASVNQKQGLKKL